jgi:hypothetical protein
MTDFPAAITRHQRRIDTAIIGLLWLLIAVIMMYDGRDAIATLGLIDPDDSLRLVQVRDLLAGQSWHDLTQYRINPAGGGGDLHWSRFIDVQIAGMIRLFELALPPVEAERWAIAFYPVLLVLLILVIFYRLLSRLGDRNFVRTGLLVAATTYSFLYYFVPLRIDHHNWQLVMSLVMLWLALGPATVARGLAAAFAIAVHLEISLEGLPYLVIFGGLFAVDWLRNPVTAPRLRAFAAGLAVIPSVWVLLMRGPDAILGTYCDAFSRPYLAGAIATGLVLTLAMGHPRFVASQRSRFALLATAGAIGACVFLLAGPACLSGPFGNLSPLVREHWYEMINEGHAIWRQPLSVMAGFAIPSLVGIVGIAWSARAMAQTRYSDNWQRLLFAAIGAFILSLLVLRTTAVTHAYVVPGYALAMMSVYRWGRAGRTALVRVPVTAACIAATPLSVSALAVGVTMPFSVEEDKAVAPLDCMTPHAADQLARLPRGTIFAPLDMSPAILVGTAHSVVASGHHRNHQAIHSVLSAFMGSSSDAEKTVRAAGATYVALCTNMTEAQNYLTYNDRGFAAALDRGTPPAWLRPLPAQSLGPLRVYRVLPATPE